MKPKRVQRKRTKGWRMPPNTVYVGRGSKWGNPFEVIKLGRFPIWFVCGETEEGYQWFGPFWDEKEAVVCACDAFADYIDEEFEQQIASELKGKDLACWCPLVDEDGNRVPCHADVLLELANKGE